MKLKKENNSPCRRNQVNTFYIIKKGYCQFGNCLNIVPQLQGVYKKKIYLYSNECSKLIQDNRYLTCRTQKEQKRKMLTIFCPNNQNMQDYLICDIPFTFTAEFFNLHLKQELICKAQNNSGFDSFNMSASLKIDNLSSNKKIHYCEKGSCSNSNLFKNCFMGVCDDMAINFPKFKFSIIKL
ncbi:hypothetical protein MXB_5140, partial [Myxobolus squamalis]